MTELATALRSYISARRGRPVTVDRLRRLAGGTSHETWAFDLRDAGSGSEPLVLRRDFDHRPLDADLRTEFTLLGDLRASRLPVPRPYWCEVDASPLERPFMVLERVEGTDVRKALRGHVPGRGALGERLARLQATVHDVAPPSALATGSAPPSPRAEVERWATAITEATPLVSAAVGWLRAHAPDADRIGLVHGDFKTNNLLFGPDGTVTILDWELAHLGDPVEDLAWTMLWTTEFDLVGGLLPAARYLRAYEAASQYLIEPARLSFWQLLALVKLAAIFLTGAARPRDGRPVRPTLQLLGRALVHIEHEIARHLGGGA